MRIPTWVKVVTAIAFLLPIFRVLAQTGDTTFSIVVTASVIHSGMWFVGAIILDRLIGFVRKGLERNKG